MIHRINILFLLVLVSFIMQAADHKGKLYSPDKSASVEWVRVNDKTVLKSTIKGVEFISEVGINLNDKDYVFDGRLKKELISPTGEVPVIYAFSSAKSPVKLEVALLDNAVAFRYTSNLGKGLLLKSEASSFSLPEKSMVYY